MRYCPRTGAWCHRESRVLLAIALAAFGAFGGLWGIWAVLLTDLSRMLNLSAGPLGFALSAGVVASIPAMILGGRAADRWGRRAVLAGSGSLMGVSFAGLGFAGDYASFLIILLLWCMASGVYDVGINAFAMDLEQTTSRRVLALLHAAFSAGGAVGALISGAFISVGIDYRHVYVGALLPVALVVLAVGVSQFPHVPSPSPGDKGKSKVTAKPGLPLALVGAVAALAFFSEGTMEDWSGIYLRQTLALPAFLGASGVAVFHASMAVGRVGAARVIERFGNHRTLLGAGLLTAGGMALALVTQEPLLVIAGFLVVGLALSAATPIAFSIAGDLAPERAGGASSVVAILGYNGFLVAPAVVGGIAELSSLQASLWTIALAGLLIAAVAVWLGRQKFIEEGSTSEEMMTDYGDATPVPHFWFQTRPNELSHREHGRLHSGLLRAHRSVLLPIEDRARPAPRREGGESSSEKAPHSVSNSEDESCCRL